MTYKIYIIIKRVLYFINSKKPQNIPFFRVKNSTLVKPQTPSFKNQDYAIVPFEFGA